MTPNGRHLTERPRTGEARDARCPQCETGFGLAVSDAHPGYGKDHKPAGAWQSESGQRPQ